MSQTEAAIELTKLAIGVMDTKYSRDEKKARILVIETFEECLKAVDKAEAPTA